ncbi:MAG: HepT-like ribonuclease domain-containing protein [Planctomycetota bacterium]|jgi:uncharacterized protein with HEPN domain
MSKRSDLDSLGDCREAILRIDAYVKGLSYDTFSDDTKTQDAVVRNLEIIGEAVKNVSGELKGKYPRVHWKDLAGLRDKLIHHYFGVNFDIVWNVIAEEMPGVLLEFEGILRTEHPG